MVSVSRIAVLNRGDAAVRFMRGLAAHNITTAGRIVSVAFLTDPDRDAPAVQLADEVCHLGPATRRNRLGQRVSAYADHDFIIEKLVANRCDAVWPGWGFVSEDASFVERLEAEGILFVGPSSAAMRTLGDKIRSKQLAEKCGVPLAAWVELPDEVDDEDVLALAGQVGYPLMVKASAGGGGRGIRRVGGGDGLLEAVQTVRREARDHFGGGSVFVERCFERARHVEVQFVAGVNRGARALGVRDCSVQRRNQKVIEETPSPVLSPLEEEQLGSATTRLAEAAGYHGVGTAEFLFDPVTREAAFLEVNARLQVEHTITELVSGVDLVQAQLDIALGREWQRGGAGNRGWAVEARLNAEDPENGFRPTPGQLRIFRPPAGPDVRVDSGVREGQTLVADFDSMIAKVMAWGPTRDHALVSLKRALGEFEVVVEDGTTNRSFLLSLLERDEVVSATATTAWLDRAVDDGSLGTPLRGAEAVLVGAVLLALGRLRQRTQRFFSDVQDGIPALADRTSVKFDLRLRGVPHEVEVHRVGPDDWLVGSGGLHRLTLDTVDAHSSVVHLDGERLRVLHSLGRNGIGIELEGEHHAITHSSAGVIASPGPALVVDVAVSVGDAVEAGQRVCTLEAMKMETAIFAEAPGVVEAVLVRPNEQVLGGQHLLTLRTSDHSDDRDDRDDRDDTDDRAIRDASAASRGLAPTGTPVCEEVAAGGAARLLKCGPLDIAELVDEVVDRVRSVLLGFDLPDDRAAAMTALLETLVEVDDRDALAPWVALDGVLPWFVDAERLFDRNLLPLADASAAVSADVAFFDFCRNHHAGEDGAILEMRPLLRAAVAHYGVQDLAPSDRLRAALVRLVGTRERADERHHLVGLLLRVLRHVHTVDGPPAASLRAHLEDVARVASRHHPAVADTSRQVIYELFERADSSRESREVASAVQRFVTDGDEEALSLIVRTDQPIGPALVRRVASGRDAAVALCARLHPTHRIVGRSSDVLELVPTPVQLSESDESAVRRVRLVVGRESLVALSHIDEGIEHLEIVLPDTTSADGLGDELARLGLPRGTTATASWVDETGHLRHLSVEGTASGQAVAFSPTAEVHPDTARRCRMDRLSAFELERHASSERVHAFVAVARDQPRDERVFVYAEVFEAPTVVATATVEEMKPFQRAYLEGLRAIRERQGERSLRDRLRWNSLHLIVHPAVRVDRRDVTRWVQTFETASRGLALREVTVHVEVIGEDTPGGVGRVEGTPVDFELRRSGDGRLDVGIAQPRLEPYQPLSELDQRSVRAEQLGVNDPWAVVDALEGAGFDGEIVHASLESGRFTELELANPDEVGPVGSGDHATLAGACALVEVDRPRGQNPCGVVVGVVSNHSPRRKQDLERVFVASDPLLGMGSLSEAECRRIIGALHLARERDLPVEWTAVSAGARIAMDSGTENLDWTAAVLRLIVEFTQAGGEMNVIVDGVNVGAQSYWNAEATMLMHTRGILVMTPEGSMVLTGRRALAASGGVVAEDERGIGGFERIMGPNGQAQYLAGDLGEAYRILMTHYDHSYNAGNGSSARLSSDDPPDRSILDSPYRHDSDATFRTVGEIFSEATNPGRKRPFAIRPVMAAVADRGAPELERFRTMQDATTAVVWETRVGGHAVTLIGIESLTVDRTGRIPLDGPSQWSGGTLYPHSSRKVARAINTASGSRPVVVLANLSGFDGSPESLRRRQLEYGAEIARAVVNFDGPIVFVVIGRYHGGAYVVFSKALNPRLTALAVEGSFASVIGGAPAAAVVFTREVQSRTDSDARVVDAERAAEAAPEEDRPRALELRDRIRQEVMLEVQGRVAAEFDSIHTVQRAVAVGSLDAVIPAARLRPAVIEVLDRERSGEMSQPT